MDNYGLTNNNFKDTSLMDNMSFDPTSILFIGSSFDNDVQISEEYLFGDQSFHVRRSQSAFPPDDDDMFGDICFLPTVPTAQTSQQKQQQQKQQQLLLQQQHQQQLLQQHFGGPPQTSAELHLRILQQMRQQSGLQLQSQVQPHPNYDILQQENLRQRQLNLQQQLFHRSGKPGLFPQYEESLPAFEKLDTSAVISESLHAFTSVSQPVRLTQQQQHIFGGITKGLLNNTYLSYRSPSLDGLLSPKELSPMIEQDVIEIIDEDMHYNPVSKVTASVNLSLERLHVAVNPIQALSIGRKTPAVQAIQKTHLVLPTDPPTAPSEPSPLKRQPSSVSNLRATVKATSPRKRHSKPSTKTGADKSQGPAIKMQCSHDGCKVTCSSIPSLLRHAMSHKWRGVYIPVRCEACQSALSNEFSVQRHIKRAKPGSLCSRMRIYSIMKSETDVESTVRFHPERPHGKKTEVVSLVWANAKYRGPSGTTTKSIAETATTDDDNRRLEKK